MNERYWDPEAFDGKGGWWVVYGALEKVSHLFSNYGQVREDLEREHWQRYAQERRARERGTSGEKQQQIGGQQREQKNQQASAHRQQRSQQEQKREEVKLPKTVQEAFAILKLTPPVTKAAVKRAYYAQALKYHPDRGGSHAQMVRINAAFEMAEKAAS